MVKMFQHLLTTTKWNPIEHIDSCHGASYENSFDDKFFKKARTLCQKPNGRKCFVYATAFLQNENTQPIEMKNSIQIGRISREREREIDIQPHFCRIACFFWQEDEKEFTQTNYSNM